jgi:hypothetical protein
MGDKDGPADVRGAEFDTRALAAVASGEWTAW